MLKKQENLIEINACSWYDDICIFMLRNGRKNMHSVLDFFLEYIAIDSQSDETSGQCPSTSGQHLMAGLLVKQLNALGAENITYDREHCYVYAGLSASDGYEDAPTLGFIAHMDTSPAVTGKDVKPLFVSNYDGNDVVLNAEKNIVFSVEEFPEIKAFVGQDLIFTDGTTLLGADDKAGVAEIMAFLSCLIEHPEMKHGKIRVAFTPDEEIGAGAYYFNVALFGADFAFTVDGGALGEIEHETFNAASGKVTIYGRSVHPGSAKGKMINALLVGMEFQGLLPVFENPMYTEGYEGFYHLDKMSGDVECTTMEYIIRDHSKQLFEQKKAFFCQCAEFINQKYGSDVVQVEVEDSYYNMKEAIAPHFHLIDNACSVMKEMGIEPVIVPVRGGTDGARLSYMGLPCPNLCTGGANFHSRFEYISVQSMEKTVEILLGLANKYSIFQN